MSLNPASAFCDSKSVVRLEDATQYGPWSLWAIGLFVQGRILEDIDPSLQNYPIGGKNTIAADKEWWIRITKQQAIKILKDDGFSRPIVRIEAKSTRTKLP